MLSGNAKLMDPLQQIRQKLRNCYRKGKALGIQKLPVLSDSAPRNARWRSTWFCPACVLGCYSVRTVIDSFTLLR